MAILSIDYSLIMNGAVYGVEQNLHQKIYAENIAVESVLRNLCVRNVMTIAEFITKLINLNEFYSILFSVKFLNVSNRIRFPNLPDLK